VHRADWFEQAKEAKDQAGKKAGQIKDDLQKQAQPAIDQAKDAKQQVNIDGRGTRWEQRARRTWAIAKGLLCGENGTR